MNSSTCSVDGCDRPDVARGYCRGHAQRVRRTGSPGPASFREFNAGGRACTVEDCDGRARVRGLCHAHNERFKRNGDPGGLIARQEPRPKPPCAVDGCGGDAEVRGWCRRHYKRWWDSGDPGPADFAPRNQFESCSAAGCDREHRTAGYCDMHYRRWRAGVRTDSLKFLTMPKPRPVVTTYHMAHAQIVVQRGPASSHVCPCGEPGKDWAYQHNDPEALFDERGYAYSLKYEQCYVAMCRSCHGTLDRDLDRRMAALT